MKKVISIILTLLMLALSICITAFAATETAEVYVTLLDENKKLALVQEKITVTDKNSNSKIDIYDALYVMHEAKCEEGTEGFKVSAGFITKLWGVANGGGYGYYVNNQSAWSLEDPLNSGDYLYAFIYTDLTAWSDTYSYFDAQTKMADNGAEIELTLTMASYPNPALVEGATITVDGVATNVKTDTNGKATIKITEGGIHLISATHKTHNLVSPVCVATVSSADTAEVYVTVSDKDGKLALAQEAVTVFDTDKDGVLSINDALYAAHEENYKGGAAEGYATSYTAYGLSLDKLWGTANGGSYGYYINNKSAWSLTDPVISGDYVNAFVYTDLTAFSDTYSYFDKSTAETDAGKGLTLTLLKAGFDASYNPISIPAANASVTINGEATEFVTDKNGKVTLTISTAGEYVISAVSKTETLVPPVCKVTVTETIDEIIDEESKEITKEKDNSKNEDAAEEEQNKEKINSPKTGTSYLIYICFAIILASGVIAITFKIKLNEK